VTCQSHDSLSNCEGLKKSVESVDLDLQNKKRPTRGRLAMPPSMVKSVVVICVRERERDEKYN
jgi:hypothetical protein